MNINTLFYHRYMHLIDRIAYVFYILLPIVALDKIYFLWFYFFEYFVKLVVAFGILCSHDPFIDYHRNLAHENRYVSVSTWLHAQLMLWLKEDKPDLVVAAYDEDLSWIKDYQSYVGKIYIYCKHHTLCTQGLNKHIAGNPGKYSVELLPNVGREAHTYLFYAKYLYA